MGNEENIAISVQHITKTFDLSPYKHNTLKSLFVNPIKNRMYSNIQTVLEDVSFDIKKGEFFGIVGKNGSGKSTLLKLIAGIYVPDTGGIVTNGKLTPFIELGVGFNPELTAHDNVFLNGALLGFNRKEMEAMYDDIVDFAELHKFMDQKLKNYSSGMQVRLAFSIAIRAQSDILLLDEVLAVGDAAFQQKCFEYFRELKRDERTIILVSHDRGAIEQYCSRAALINEGKLVAIDKPSRIFARYSDITLKQLGDAEQAESDKKKDEKTPDTKSKNRWGTKAVEITSAEVLVNGAKERLCKPGDIITIRFRCKANKDVEQPVYGVTMARVGEAPIFVVNTLLKGQKTQSLKAGEEIEVSFSTKNIFGDGKYFISPAIADSHGSVIYDWRNELLKLRLAGQKNTYAIVNPDYDIDIGSAGRDITKKG